MNQWASGVRGEAIYQNIVTSCINNSLKINKLEDFKEKKYTFVSKFIII